MKFESDLKTFVINNFFKRLFYTLSLFGFLLIVYLYSINNQISNSVLIFIIIFSLVLTIHIIFLFKYTWHLITALVLLISIYEVYYVQKGIYIGDAKGYTLFDVFGISFITLIPNIIFLIISFYLNRTKKAI